MDQRIFHGNLTPTDIAEALLSAFNRGNLRTQLLGESNHLVVQIASRPGAASGGQTALAVSIQKVEDGVMVQIGQQAWLGVAASLGQTAMVVLTISPRILKTSSLPRKSGRPSIRSHGHLAPALNYPNDWRA
jgi:hypothetical protein